MRLPFSITLQPDRPLHDQVVLAVTKAIVRKQLQPGDRFPSVRTLSQELQINPNTAQRIVGTLVERGLLEVQPGVGTTVTASPPAPPAAARAALREHLEPLVVEARRLGLTFADLLELIRREWR